MFPKSTLTCLPAVPQYARVLSLGVATCAALLFIGYKHESVPEPAPAARVLSLECSPRAIAFSPDGKWLATAGGQMEPVGELRIWDTTRLAGTASLIGHHHSLRGLAFNASGSLLATISYDRTLRLWNMVDNPREEHVCCLDADPAALVVSPDGKRVAVSSDDRSIRIFNTQTGRLELRFDCQYPCFTCMAFSLDGSQLATWSLGQPTIDVWDTDRGLPQSKLPRPAKIPIESKGFESWLMTWSSHGPTLFTAQSGEIEIWAAAIGEVRRLTQPDARWLGAMALSSDGRVLAVGDSQGMIHLWDIETGARVLAIAGQDGLVTALSMSPDGNLVACAGRDRTVIVKGCDWARAVPPPNRSRPGRAARRPGPS
jgi:WD40 repeat protein